MEIKVCKTEEQLEELAKLANEIWHEYFVSIISMEQIDYMVDKFQSYQAIKTAMIEEQYTYFLVYEKERLIGYCGVKPDRERVFLSKLYLHKDARGKGLSSALLLEAMKYTRELEKSAIYLTCNKHNQHSLDVYYRKGFKFIDEVQNDIGQGFIMDDYILQLTI